MNDPSTSAQTPGSADVEAEVKAQRVEGARRRRGTLARILRVVVPLALLTTCADVTLGRFTVFGARSKQSEAKGILKCLATSAEADAADWTGVVDAAGLNRAGVPCPASTKMRYVFWRTPLGVSPIVFGGRAAPGFHREIGDDFWIAPKGGAPIHCFDALPPRRLLIPVRVEVSADPRCAQMLSLVGGDLSTLRPVD